MYSEAGIFGGGSLYSEAGPYIRRRVLIFGGGSLYSEAGPYIQRRVLIFRGGSLYSEAGSLYSEAGPYIRRRVPIFGGGSLYSEAGRRVLIFGGGSLYSEAGPYIRRRVLIFGGYIENKNPMNGNAISVHTISNDKIGHIPEMLARKLIGLWRSGYITKINGNITGDARSG